jgi:hypothetical protein
LADLEAREHKHRLALMELVERRETILSNWRAEQKAIADKRKTLAELQKAHGEFTEKELASAETAQLEELED